MAMAFLERGKYCKNQFYVTIAPSKIFAKNKQKSFMLLQYVVAAVCLKFKLLLLGPFIAWFYDYHSYTQVARP